jgi:hypothetical protein
LPAARMVLRQTAGPPDRARLRSLASSSVSVDGTSVVGLSELEILKMDASVLLGTGIFIMRIVASIHLG